MGYQDPGEIHPGLRAADPACRILMMVLRLFWAPIHVGPWIAGSGLPQQRPVEPLLDTDII